MSYKEDLEFAFDETKSKGYDTVQVLVSKSYPEFIYGLKKYVIENNIRYYPHYHITTLISKHITGDKYLLALDCDSFVGCEDAKRELDRQNICYVVIESSPDRYWVICDIIGTITENIRAAEVIPGVDQKYLSCCKSKKKINLRAYPKGGFIPKFQQDIDKISDRHGVFKKWLFDFRDYWGSNDIKLISEQLSPDKSYLFEDKLVTRHPFSHMEV